MTATPVLSPWTVVKHDGGGYDVVDAAGIRANSVPIDRKVHATVWAMLVRSHLPEGTAGNPGIIPDGIMMRIYGDRAAFQKWANHDSSRKVVDACASWNCYVQSHRVWRGSGDMSMRFEAIDARVTQWLHHDDWSPLPDWAQPSVFGDIPS